MTTANESELLLLAFRYISGEMTDEESALFEEQLDHDQPARSAVARAVQVGQAVALAKRELPPMTMGGLAKDNLAGDSGSGETRRRWRAVAAAVAVGLLVAVAIAHWSDFVTSMSSTRHNVASGSRPGAEPAVDRPSQHAGSDNAVGRLLALWSGSESDFGQLFDELTLDAATSNDEAAEPDVLSWTPFAADGEIEFIVPDWMLAAVMPEDDSDSDHTIDMPEEN